MGAALAGTDCSAGAFKPGEGRAALIRQTLDRLPLLFIENRGQVDSGAVKYYVKGSDKTLYFTPGEITIALKNNEGGAPGRWAVKLDFAGADLRAGPAGRDLQDTAFSYFKGKPGDWKKGIAAFGRVVYEDLWPGIDLVFSGAANRLEYEFLVHPGADPCEIRLVYRGVENLAIEETGALRVSTPAGSFTDGVPSAYQAIDGGRKEVPMTYAIREDGGNNGYSYGFDVGDYDPSHLLVLDPSLLLYCGYIGGADNEWGYDIAVNDQGNAYVTGHTDFSQATFPAVVGPGLTSHTGNGYHDAFVARVNDVGTGLDYCGYIAGEQGDFGRGVAVDGQGNAYVAGYTFSHENTFPVLVGPDLTFNGGGFYPKDAFVAKIPPFHVLLRAGNVDTGSGDPADVLFVNGSAGGDASRTVVNPPGARTTAVMAAPRAGPKPAAFALYVMPGEAGPADPAVQPRGIGTACFPMPLSNGSPLPPPLTLVNNIGNPGLLGSPLLHGIPPAPAYIVRNLLLSPGTWTLQGIIYDNDSQGAPVSLTNAVILIQQ